MNQIFDPDSPVMSALSKVFDIILLNLLFIITSLPVFTAGASVTALYHVLFKMNREESAHPIMEYCKAFRSEFRHSTKLLLLLLIPIIVLFADMVMVCTGFLSEPIVINAALIVIAVAFLMGVSYVFPYSAYFENSVFETLLNSFKMAFHNFPVSIAVATLNCIPWVLLFVFPAGFAKSLMIWIFLGFAGLACVNAMLLQKVFNKYILT